MRDGDWAGPFDGVAPAAASDTVFPIISFSVVYSINPVIRRIWILLNTCGRGPPAVITNLLHEEIYFRPGEPEGIAAPDRLFLIGPINVQQQRMSRDWVFHNQTIPNQEHLTKEQQLLLLIRDPPF